MKIATWNINGVKARIDLACTWLREAKPDVVCLQEIKSVDGSFPTAVFAELGYNVAVAGQKGFNGVAILSRRPIEDVTRQLPGDANDAQARYIEAVISTRQGVVRIGSLYLPNGNPIGSDRFAYKLDWMRRLVAHARTQLAGEHPLVLAGDYNVIPEPLDAKTPEAWRNDALFQPQPRAAFRTLLNFGFTDAIRACDPSGGNFTFWDYQAGAWNKDNGIRIDHLLLSPQATDRLTSAQIDKHVRGWEKPSDHVPVWINLDLD
jgi:exodeoxyribonuclease III